MNEVSIIINGTRYDSVETHCMAAICEFCDLHEICSDVYDSICEALNISRTSIFKKSDKKFEV